MKDDETVHAQVTPLNYQKIQSLDQQKYNTSYPENWVRVLPGSDAKRLAPGTLVRERFILEEQIGRGGMGTVYRARDLRKEEAYDNDPHIAIKFLNEHLRDQQQAFIALQREAKKSQVLSHPNIVTVYDFDRDQDLVYLSMEYLQGETLADFIEKKRTGIPWQQAVIIIEGVASGLAYAHQKGFVHADLKPSNVFLAKNGSIKLLDFGIAQAVKVLSQEYGNDTYFDAGSLGALTPSYASVDMLDNKTPIPSDDLYALGCLMYILLTGVHPLHTENGHKLTAKQAYEANLTTDISGVFGKTLPKRYCQALERCLSFKREQRFQDATEFLDAIKPPAKLNKSLIVTLSVLAVAAALAWWLLVKQLDFFIRLQNLPDNMSYQIASIELGDSRLNKGDIDQAYHLYVTAWDSSHDLVNLAPTDHHKLKVIIHRRIDNITRQLLLEAEDLIQARTPTDRLFQLRSSLYFIQRSDLGTLDSAISDQLQAMDQVIKNDGND